MPDELLALGELQPLEELGRVPDREPRDCGDGLPINEDREALGLQPVALADRAECQRAVILFLVFIILAEHTAALGRSEEHTSELQSRLHLVCRLLLEKKNKTEI